MNDLDLCLEVISR